MPKMNRRLGSLTAQRSATPTSPDQARFFMNFRFNLQGLRNTLPNVFGRGSYSGVTWGPCNKSGTAATFGVGTSFGASSPQGPVNDPGQVKVNSDGG